MTGSLPRRAAFPWKDGQPPHLPCKPGDVGPIVLLPGDPARVGLAARLLPGARDLGQRREYRMATAEVAGVPVTLCSTGIGGPSTEIALVELANLGARIAIRIGGMGSIAPGLTLGGMLVVDEAIGNTGTARAYGGGNGVAADPDVVAALAQATAADGRAWKVGRVATTDSYYLGQGRPLSADADGPDPEHDPVVRFARAGALGCDMEAETVLTVGKALGLRCGAILAVHGDRVADKWLEDYEPAQEAVVRIAVAAALSLMSSAT